MATLEMFLNGFINSLISFLPRDPFQGILQSVAPSGQIMNYINWFIPIGDMVNVLTIWTGAIAAWYVWQTIARWLHLVS